VLVPTVPTAAPKTPAVAVLDPADAPQWQTWVKDLGWKVIVPAESAQPVVDSRTQAVDAAVRDAIQKSGVDPERVYLAGRGDTASSVFYAISRIPDLWAAAIMLGGSPEPALATGRIFAINYTNVPVLWVSAGAADPELVAKLKTAGVNIEWRAATSITNAAVFEWLRSHRRDEFPLSVDCETNSPTFGRCYWIQMTRFDASERNDVLPQTRVNLGAGATLDLGNFGFKREDPDPGLLVSFLGEKYTGPLKMGDRIIELEGKPIKDARAYLHLMNQVTANRRVIIMLLRGKDRLRVETSLIAPHHEAGPTARVQARYDAETKQIEIISRTATEMRVTVPPQWVPSGLNWNGLAIDEINKPGCILLKMEKELLHAEVCPAN
jgi:predicted esterase